MHAIQIIYISICYLLDFISSTASVTPILKHSFIFYSFAIDEFLGGTGGLEHLRQGHYH